MLTYQLDREEPDALYVQLYKAVRADIASGVLHSGDRLPSKRKFAQQLGVSIITVEGAYEQLRAEGYISGAQRHGYFVSNLLPQPLSNAQEAPVAAQEDVTAAHFDETLNGPDVNVLGTTFPYSRWAHAMRAALSQSDEETLHAETHLFGSPRLRAAVCKLLKDFRNINVSPDQVIIGAGSQVLYGLLVQLLGRNGIVAIEDPGYQRLRSIYESHGMTVQPLAVDKQGMRSDLLRASNARIAHVMPSHQLPCGIVTLAPRRYELLSWASEESDRYIVEDDFDCEFRMQGKPVPALMSMDASDSVIYVNTFTKSLGPAFRMGYMVLPPQLAKAYQERLGFYSCTVSAIDQLAMALFIESGDFERHVSRIRTTAGRQQHAFVAALQTSSLQDRCSVRSMGAGLHVVVAFNSTVDDQTLAAKASAAGVTLTPFSQYHASDALGVPEGHESVQRFVLGFPLQQPNTPESAVSALCAAWA